MPLPVWTSPASDNVISHSLSLRRFNMFLVK